MNPADAPPDTRGDAVREVRADWRHQASELGGRNTLLWHRDLPTGTFDLTVAHPGGVAKLLAGVTTLLSELVRETVALTEARRRVGAIRAKTVELSREHGLTSGFIAVGMATWTLRRAPVPPRAPVLLRGCTIVPTDASHRDFAITLERDVVLNPVLAHYLTSELGLELDPAELAGLSTRRAGFDPRPTYQLLEELCADVPGFGVGPQMVISTYPWAKLPFVAEFAAETTDGMPGAGLVDRLAREVAGGDGAGTDSAGADGEANDDADGAAGGDSGQTHGGVTADETHEQALDDPVVLDADRAQRAVIRAVREGKSLVVEAMPGTGRTQTVANVVADRVAAGKRVLVLSEHRPTLDSLRLRLAQVGLDHLVLPLREVPQGARDLAADLLASCDAAGWSPEGSVGEAADQAGPDDAAEMPASGAATPLVEHYRTMHTRHAPWEASLAQAQVALTELAGRPRPPVSHVRLTGGPLRDLVPDRRAEVIGSLVEAASIGAWERGRSEDPWYGAAVVSQDDAGRAEDLVRRLVGGELEHARAAVREVCAEAGLPEPLTLRQWGSHLELMGRARDTLDVFRPQIYEAPLDQFVSALTQRGSEERPSAMARSRLRRQVRGLLRPGSPPTDLSAHVRAAAQEKTEWEALAGRAARPTTPAGWEAAAESYERIESDLDWLAGVLEPTDPGKDLHTTHLDQVLERLLRLEARTDRLPVTATAYGLLQPLREEGLGDLVDDLARRGVAADDVAGEVDLVFWASLADHLVTGQQGFRQRGPELHSALEDFAAVDRERMARTADAVRDSAARVAAGAVARHPDQVERLRDAVDGPPVLDVAALLGEVRDVAQAVRPVWTASPLVVPATLPTDLDFDLVVVEDAARLPIAHAVPGLHRAGQVLGLGSSHDLPARPFIACVDERAEDRAADSTVAGGSAFAALSGVLPVLGLDVLYRPIDQRLVQPVLERAHPDTHAYPGVLRSPRVTVLPAAGTERVVTRMVDLVMEHAKTTPWQSLAVLAQDPALAEDLDRALRGRIALLDLGRSFREDAAESLLATTVDRAGAEVRDRVLLALSPLRPVDPDWVATALSVARRSVIVVADGPVDEWPDGPGLDLLRRAAEGARQTPGTSEFDSPLVADLADKLRAHDLTVRGGYGTGRFGIELVVDDPQETGRPLVAVHTDSSPVQVVSRDELRLRAEQLRMRGWVPVQVWSTDLFRDPAREVARILEITREASAARGRR
ncbi:hypothetical protein [Ornithinicoccus hortensis]|uniref:hypothetical protein n=1 Tax=Ornithinicoccus hortensis TaxID=82346 RepID=UPI001152C3A7|nr:hypothetical protein [Ornithinicoccus hortensis]